MGRATGAERSARRRRAYAGRDGIAGGRPTRRFRDYAAGVAYPEIGLVLLTIKPVHPNSQHDLGEVFRHELAHVALEDAVSGRSIPRWFNEGFAVMASGETSFVRMQTLWTATLSDNLLTLAQLDRTFPRRRKIKPASPTPEAADVVRFLVRREEQHRFRGLVSRLRDGETMDAALLNSYGEETSSLESEWRDDVAKRFTFWPVLCSGTVIWAGTLGLFALGWRKRRRKAAATLQRWSAKRPLEEAARRNLALRADPAPPPPRVHIVLGPAPPPTTPHPRFRPPPCTACPKSKSPKSSTTAPGTRLH